MESYTELVALTSQSAENGMELTLWNYGCGHCKICEMRKNMI
jgi:hypothetical protein